MISSKPSAAPTASTSKAKSTKKQQETSIETINSPGVAAAEAVSDSDDEADVPDLSPSALRFSKLKSLDFAACYSAVSDDPTLLAEDTTDALLVEAFSVAMKGDDKRARECVEKGLMIQYCLKLGRDGVALFFKRCVHLPEGSEVNGYHRKLTQFSLYRMTGSDPRALQMFLEDVKQTGDRMVNRAHVVAAERESQKAANPEGKEQIQLVASDPSTVITFETPDGPPPENLTITGEGSEDLDPVLVREFLQKRWDIFQSFSKGMQSALKEKSLDKVNKVLGKLDVADAEEIVQQLQESGILSVSESTLLLLPMRNFPAADHRPLV